MNQLKSNSFKLPRYVWLLGSLALFGLAACGGGGSGGTVDTNNTGNLLTATSSSIVPPGAICATGGIQVDSGIDINANGLLDAAEIDNSETICNGTNGTNGTNGLISLIATSAEPVGTNYLFGGTRIQSGIDNNSD